VTSIPIADMRDRLLSMDDVHTRLQRTEPLSIEHLSTETSVSFRFDHDWVADADVVDVEPVRAYVTVNGTERQLTRGAAFQAAANYGVSGALMRKLPTPNLEADLNYFYSGGVEGKEYNLLSIGDLASAFTRPTLVPFSNLMLLERTTEGLQEHFGSDVEILADYKFSNTLQSTDIRLIVPNYSTVITDGDMPDVPTGSDDLWFAGVHLFNSVIGKGMTSMDAYLFRWWCTNGATVQNNAVGLWSRRHDGQDEDVYDWARTSVDEVFDGMAARFDKVQALTSLDVTRNLGEVVRTLFDQYEVPKSQRDGIMEALVRSARPTMYTVMNAITEEANDLTLSAARADRLMRIGGDIPTETFDPMKAKIWREGHAADTTTPNPYEIQVLA
jgi:hypothetical protein